MSTISVPEAHRDHSLALRDRSLFIRLRDPGDPTDREQVVRRFLPLARSVARAQAYGPETFDDIFQVACVGLVKAIDRFDLDRQIAFSSYAVPTMTGEIKRYYRDRTWMVRPPRPIQELSLRVDRAVEAWGRRHGVAPTVGELAELLDVSDEAVLEVLQAREGRNMMSIDHPTSDDRGAPGAPLAELVGAMDEAFALLEGQAAFEGLLRHLTPRDRRIVRMRFEHDMTQAEIGAAHGLSQMQVSRILRTALDRVRVMAEARRRREERSPSSTRR